MVFSVYSRASKSQRADVISPHVQSVPFRFMWHMVAKVTVSFRQLRPMLSTFFQLLPSRISVRTISFTSIARLPHRLPLIRRYDPDDFFPSPA